MPTTDEFISLTSKKLLGFVDFDLYLMKYLRKAIREATKRLFIQGSFEERMPISGSDTNEITVELKPVLQDAVAHDGLGRLLDLADPDLRIAAFENVSGQTYEVGASYVEFPREIRINPRTGKAEYDRLVEGVGVQATADSVVIGGSTITLVVDSLFEAGGAGDHTGRQVRVFLVLGPGDIGNTATAAIETCTVFYDGENKITTVGYLGQTVPEPNEDAYVVQLIGVMVYRDTASNRPTERPSQVFFIGTVAGNDATPDTFDISGQNIVQAQSAGQVTIDPLTSWYDGASNPGGTVQEAVDKIIYDLATVVTGDLTIAGSQKISSAELPLWYDSTTNPIDSVYGQLYKIVYDLKFLDGEAGESGAKKISAYSPGDWADTEGAAFGSIQDVLNDFVAALTSVTGQRGAGKLTAPALPDWADGTTNPAVRLDQALSKIVTDLTSSVDAGGSGKIYSIDLGGDPYAIGAGPLVIQIAGLQGALNETAVYNERRSEFAAITGLKQVHRKAGGGYIRAIATRFKGDDPFDCVVRMVAVGDSGGILYMEPAATTGTWSNITAASGYASQFNGIAYGPQGFALVGNSGEIQSFVSSTTRRKTGGNNLNDVAYNAGASLYCAVGNSGDIWTSPDNVVWTQRTGASGMSSDNYLAIESDGTQFVVTSALGRIMNSTNGISWTKRTDAPVGVGPTVYIDKQLQYTARHGFVALFFDGGSSSFQGVSYSADGVTWVHQSTSVNASFGSSYRLALLDRQVAYFVTQGTYFEAIVSEDTTQAPTLQTSGYQMLLNIADLKIISAINVKGQLYVCGRESSGDGIIMAGPIFRPNTFVGV